MKNRIISLILCFAAAACFNVYASEGAVEPLEQEVVLEEAEFIPTQEPVSEEITEVSELVSEEEPASEGVNVALGCDVTVTNVRGIPINTNAGDAASQAVDGSYATGTSGNGVYEYNINLALHDVYPVNKVNMIFLICKFAGDFEIQTSLDGISYNPVGNINVTPTTVVNTTGANFYTLDFDTVFARYIKIVDKATHSGLGFRVAEIEVYEDEGFEGEVFSPELGYEVVGENENAPIDNLFAGTIRANAKIFYYGENKNITLVSGLYNSKTKEMLSLTTTPFELTNGTNSFFADVEVSAEETGLISYDELSDANIALGAACRLLSSADQSEVEANNGAVAAHATDGDMNTKAQATGVYNWTLEVDLGEVKEISSLRIFFAENGFPTDFDIMVSEDFTNWETVKSFSGNDRGGEHIISFDKSAARYIRVVDEVPQPGVRQMQVFEFEAFEKKLKADYEIRSFIIDEEKNPLINSAYILN